jgi:hypothetical protein
MKRMTVLLAICLAVLGTVVAKADGNSFDVFDATKPNKLSWSIPAKVASFESELGVSEKQLGRTVNLIVSDPSGPVDFESSFKLSCAGDIDNLMLMTGFTRKADLLAGHSGWFCNGYEQSLNWLRNYLQGGDLSGDKKTEILYPPSVEQEQMKNLVGLKMTFSQGDVVRTWDLAFVVKVVHKDTAAFSRGAGSAVAATEKSMSPDQLQSYQDRLGNGETPLFLVTCYWGSDMSFSGWPVWGRYVFVMFPEPATA